MSRSRTSLKRWARTQGLNDLIVFTTMAASSASSGALVSTTGWETMNAAALPIVALVASVAAWLAWRRRRPARGVAAD